jgi:hypothetical protein
MNSTHLITAGRTANVENDPADLLALVASLAEALEAAEARLAAFTEDWGTITVDNPDGVNVRPRDTAIAEVDGWNSSRMVRFGKTDRGAVVSRLTGPWTIRDREELG